MGGLMELAGFLVSLDRSRTRVACDLGRVDHVAASHGMGLTVPRHGLDLA